MADLIINVDFGAATLTGAPVLRDPSNTFGVRRTDTLAVVVAAGTEMTSTAIAGQWECVIADAVPSVTYAYHVQATVNGAAISFGGDRTMSAGSTLPSYLTVEEADAMAGNLYGFAAWASASAGDKLKALASATSRVDTSRQYQGRKADPTQELEFPRYDGCKAIAPDPTSGEPTVPSKIELATLYEADSILAGRRDRVLEAQHNGLTAQEIGTAREQYAPPTAGGVPILCREANQLAGTYRLRSGSLR